MEESEKAGTRCQAGPEPCRPAENPRGAAGGWRPSRVLDGGQGQFRGDVAGQGDPSWSAGLVVTGEAGRRADGSKRAVCPGLASRARPHPHARPQVCTHLRRCARGGRGCGHMRTGWAAASPPPQPHSWHFPFLEVCCPRNPFPGEDFSEAAANSHSCRGVPPQTLPGMSLFSFISGAREAARGRGSLACSCTRLPPGHVHPGSQGVLLLPLG